MSAIPILFDKGSDVFPEKGITHPDRTFVCKICGEFSNDAMERMHSRGVKGFCHADFVKIHYVHHMENKRINVYKFARSVDGWIFTSNRYYRYNVATNTVLINYDISPICYIFTKITGFSKNKTVSKDLFIYHEAVISAMKDWRDNDQMSLRHQFLRHMDYECRLCKAKYEVFPTDEIICAHLEGCLKTYARILI